MLAFLEKYWLILVLAGVGAVLLSIFIVFAVKLSKQFVDSNYVPGQPYVPDLKYSYPEKTDEHMLKVRKVRELEIDENYPFRNKKWWFRIGEFLVQILEFLVAFPLSSIVLGLKIKGKKNLRKHKKLLKNGAITICNHVIMWDYICVLNSIFPHKQYHPAWAGNMVGSNRTLIRLVGGIPIPTHDIKALVKFNKTFEEIFNERKWVHFFPEGSLWFYYQKIRPFHIGAFKYAVKYHRPIVPMAISYRPVNKLQYLFGRRKPCITLNIGEPIMFDLELNLADASEKLSKDSYNEMQRLAGILE